ncbi:replication-associated protein [Sewage-associated circular DNA virus-33]|uniref:replication-associated protein n=1 Tax=Sewage-associated circular DNA virus-33 TaxID=1592100 RepID=UPI0005862CFB|nr:replication-associated protein [Sewage-associated circular DNA virus-33]AJD07562.1 replication-associated protein [Sewage-associated circular DNA virus-33]
MPSSNSIQARYWLLTINDTDDNVSWSPPTAINTGPWTIVQWLRGQKEIGTNTNREHWQLFVAFKKKIRLSPVKQLFGGARVHAEPSRSEAAEEYVFKEDTAIANTRFELGAKAFNRASKTDWALAKKCAKEGNIDGVPDDVYIKYYNTLKTIAKDNMKPAENLDAVCGIWYYGPPGVGKSHRARSEFPGAYMKMQNKWWCGYQNEDFVILDDFDSKQLGHHLKIWADKYAFIAETKGYAINIRPKKFIITSNYSIDQIFCEDSVLANAIKRRFEVREIPLRLF